MTAATRAKRLRCRRLSNPPRSASHLPSGAVFPRGRWCVFPAGGFWEVHRPGAGREFPLQLPSWPRKLHRLESLRPVSMPWVAGLEAWQGHTQAGRLCNVAETSQSWSEGGEIGRMSFARSSSCEPGIHLVPVLPWYFYRMPEFSPEENEGKVILYEF